MKWWVASAAYFCLVFIAMPHFSSPRYALFGAGFIYLILLVLVVRRYRLKARCLKRVLESGLYPRYLALIDSMGLTCSLTVNEDRKIEFLNECMLEREAIKAEAEVAGIKLEDLDRHISAQAKRRSSPPLVRKGLVVLLLISLVKLPYACSKLASVDWSSLKTRPEMSARQFSPTDDAAVAPSMSADMIATDCVDGRHIARWPNGNRMVEGLYDDDLRRGPWTQFYQNGQMALKVNYQAGRENGPLLAWYPNGKRKLVMNYVNGTPSGRIKTWHQNGNDRSDGLLQGETKTGHWTTWYENGNKESEGRYSHGKAEGLWKFWHSNGRLQAMGECAGDFPVGEWQYWNEHGELISD